MTAKRSEDLTEDTVRTLSKMPLTRSLTSTQLQTLAHAVHVCVVCVLALGRVASPLPSPSSTWSRHITIAPALQIEEFQRGDYIIRKGEEGHTFYMIRKGTCVATNIPNNEPDVSIAEGNYFGERALLMNEPRAADVVAASDHVRAPLCASTPWHRHRHRLVGNDAHAARGVAFTLCRWCCCHWSVTTFTASWARWKTCWCRTCESCCFNVLLLFCTPLAHTLSHLIRFFQRPQLAARSGGHA